MRRLGAHIPRGLVLLPLLAALPAGCVLPKFGVSGAELSWFLAEVNEDDGEEALRIRSCEGALATTVEFEITDDDDDDRSKRFSWSCAEGYRTPSEFFTGASDVFVDLSPGNYRMMVSAVDDPALRGGEGDMLVVSEDDDIVGIGSEDATLVQWDILPVAYDWNIELSGTDACQTFTAALAYADPQGALPELEEEADGPLIYRENLRSDADASLGGADNDCSADLEGAHTIVGVDRGSYTLHVALDGGEACEIDVVIDGRHGTLALDLGELPC